jgi:hypothetical protein
MAGEIPRGLHNMCELIHPASECNIPAALFAKKNREAFAEGSSIAELFH